MLAIISASICAQVVLIVGGISALMFLLSCSYEKKIVVILIS